MRAMSAFRCARTSGEKCARLAPRRYRSFDPSKVDDWLESGWRSDTHP